MAASQNLSQVSRSIKSPISKGGVLTIHGFGVCVRMQSGHLEIKDGTGSERRTIKLARVNHNLRRLVCISDDGFVTLSALKWLSDIGASLVMLDRIGKVVFITGPTAPSDARLRLAQARALTNGTALAISKELISAKLRGQENVARDKLKNSATADAITGFQVKLDDADDLDSVRALEAHAAVAYWNAWRDVPILWPKSDLRKVPDHWRTFGIRASPLSGGPRLAVNPASALLNFVFAICESEARLALVAVGLDPGIGFLHFPRANRDSLAFDIMEPVRPEVERWLYQWLSTEPLRRSDFFETVKGNCRLMTQLCARLSETAPTWGKLVAPWAEYVARTLWATTSPSKSERRLSTSLTQQHRRIAKGRPSFSEVKVPKPERLCRGCGKTLQGGSTNCTECDVEIATKRLVEAAMVGRIAGHTTEAIAKEAATHRKHAQAKAAWNPAKQPSWLTEQFFSDKIQPALARASATAIAKKIGVSRWYAGRIREGYRPHPRHWRALAKLVGFTANKAGIQPAPFLGHRAGVLTVA
jgi:CRISPR-associated endonuclease Cas1